MIDENTFCENLGRTARALAASKGLRTCDLEQGCDLFPGYFSTVTRRRVSISFYKVCRIAKFLDISLDDFMNFVESGKYANYNHGNTKLK